MSTVQGLFLQLEREEYHLAVRGHVTTGQVYHSTSSQSPVDDGFLAPALCETFYQITNTGKCMLRDVSTLNRQTDRRTHTTHTHARTHTRTYTPQAIRTYKLNCLTKIFQEFNMT